MYNFLPIAEPSLRISSQTRIVTIVLFYAAALSFYAVYIQSIGSGIDNFSGLLEPTLCVGLSSLPLIKPEKSYDDAYALKLLILKENKNKSGIYRFINKLNYNFNVGSSKNLSNRFTQYFNLSYISTVKNDLTISRALIKYGYSNFIIEILEYCDVPVLLEREQHYFDLLKPSYNIAF
ncbi:LAGLIDADG homing endonuclease (mitochondrion) [Rhizoctonia solani AG-1 IB]|uniref:LAGLIDADG homing endonuclease n=1 Tax=Thanatephorus cucumeris (strain AG1-IB / isolate 7/3/14) TaxID=1108050 RepID=M5BL26_THACB|nr:LAGLIDADG homing endonuclease [Rhizoctonia solani AG-1 IB]